MPDVARFAMPKQVKITGRSSSITNSFVNGIIPVVWPTEGEVDEALSILGMEGVPTCAYCGDPATEWDHLRPLVERQKPTGYISEIRNLVPACGKCNQSKGNKPWRDWLFGPSPLSPATRGVANLDERASRLQRYEEWGSAARLDLRAVIGEELWDQHWANHAAVLALMREAELTASEIRARIRDNASPLDEPPLQEAPSDAIGG